MKYVKHEYRAALVCKST
uniref:Uncharacterized protein n=1 Tax=Rhizophora mucronata TaxID=61149 RepID=A0A2P2PH62_RHIMU